MHPVWVLDGERLTGIVGTRATPLKRTSLAHSPYISVSYWSPGQDVAVAECAARWIAPAELAAAWAALASAPAPAGYDPATVWPAGPDAGDFTALALTPWRVMVRRAPDFAAGVLVRVWRATEQHAPAGGASGAVGSAASCGAR